MPIYKATNLHVPAWGLVVTFPQPFATAPKVAVAAQDQNKTADFAADGPSGFTLFVFDRNRRSVGGLAGYTATDE